MKKYMGFVDGQEVWEHVPAFDAQLQAELRLAASKQDREWSAVLVDVREYDIRDKVDELLADLNRDPDRNYTREQVEYALVAVLEARIEHVCDTLTDFNCERDCKWGKLFWRMIDR